MSPHCQLRALAVSTAIGQGQRLEPRPGAAPSDSLSMNSKLKRTLVLLTVALVTAAAAAEAVAQYKIHDDCLGDWDYCDSFWIRGHDRFGEGAFETLPFIDDDEEFLSRGMLERARRLDCRKGHEILSRRGFERLRPVDCHGRTFTYFGTRDGASFKIQLNPSSGRILRLEPI
jgi:hypothetical protein